MNNYFLFGTEAVNLHLQGAETSAIASSVKNNGGALYLHSSRANGSELLQAYDGWRSWVEITEQMYFKILNQITTL